VLRTTKGRQSPALFVCSGVRATRCDTRPSEIHRKLVRFRVAFPRSYIVGLPPCMIRLVNVYKSFGPKRVLEGFTLDVAEGETMVIIGYSGTGKSVEIKHIVGLLEPDRGEVWVDGR